MAPEDSSKTTSFLTFPPWETELWIGEHGVRVRGHRRLDVPLMSCAPERTPTLLWVREASAKHWPMSSGVATGLPAPSIRDLDSVLLPMSAREQVLPYGSWPTPITSEVVVAQAVRLYDAKADGEDLIWAEARPAEGGRTALVRRSPDGTTAELLDQKANARTAVHEYGGGAWWVRDGVVWYAEWADQRLYRRDPDGGRPTPLTPEPEVPKGDRYADGDVSPDGKWIVCIREHHPQGGSVVDVRNELVRMAAHEPSTPEVVVSGPDFVCSPRWSPDGRRPCSGRGGHPNMASAPPES